MLRIAFSFVLLGFIMSGFAAAAAPDGNIVRSERSFWRAPDPTPKPQAEGGEEDQGTPAAPAAPEGANVTEVARPWSELTSMLTSSVNRMVALLRDAKRRVIIVRPGQETPGEPEEPEEGEVQKEADPKSRRSRRRRSAAQARQLSPLASSASMRV